MKNRIALLTLLLLGTLNCFAATNRVDPAIQNNISYHENLYKEIAEADRTFFDAFNKQDVEKIKTMFTEDLEFFHDNGGFLDYVKNIEATKRLFANNKTLKRELIKDSLKVYPVNGYGAIETGEHRFCHIENQKLDCGIFKFMTIWRKESGTWKMARVVSYGH